MRAHSSGRVTSFVTTREMKCAGVRSYILQGTTWAMQCVPPSRKTSMSIRKQSSPRGRQPHTWPSVYFTAVVEEGAGTHRATVRPSVRPSRTQSIPLAHISLTTHSTTRAQDQYQNHPTNKHIVNKSQCNSKHSTAEVHSGMTPWSFQMPTFRSSHHRMVQF
jgi:hypothetical protein